MVAARNAAIDRWRKLSRSLDVPLTEEITAKTAAPEEEICELIDTMPPPDREIFIRKYYFLETAAEIAAGTAAYAPVGSRMHLIRMDGDRLVIDDCYNANPQSMAEGIRMLAASRQKKRLAVLGDMGELGALTAQAHRDMGTLCRELGIETVAVGEKMKALTETDPEAQWFAGVEEAMPAVRARFTPGTAVLVKASHAMHFENIVKELEKE